MVLLMKGRTQRKEKEYWRKKKAEMSVVDPFTKARQALVEESILSSGVTDQRVLKAFLTVLRHEFVFPEYTDQAYADGPLPIGEGQVTTPLSLAAQMTQALHLQGNERVLEIGTGCGYQAAILSPYKYRFFRKGRWKRSGKIA